VIVDLAAIDREAVAVHDSGRFRACDEEGVDVRAQPVRVRDLVVGARCDEETSLVVGARRERLAAPMVVEGEAAFEPSAQRGNRARQRP
jgi:hypothetical protein